MQPGRHIMSHLYVLLPGQGADPWAGALAAACDRHQTAAAVKHAADTALPWCCHCSEASPTCAAHGRGCS